LEKHFLNLAGEYRVCAELLKRELFATITYGNHKAVDIFAIAEGRRKAAVIEVKASDDRRFVTRYFQKSADSRPDFWVFYSVRPDGKGGFDEEFFVLANSELEPIQIRRNNKGQLISAEEAAALAANGVDNVSREDVEPFRDEWKKIVEFCKD